MKNYNNVLYSTIAVLYWRIIVRARNEQLQFYSEVLY